MVIQNKEVRWISKGRTISKSEQHKDLFIVTNADGIRFHTVSSSEDVMRRIYPEDKPTKQNKTMKQRPEDVHSYSSKPFNINVTAIPQLDEQTLYNFEVVQNPSGEILETVEGVEYLDLDRVREELIYKWLINA